MILILVISFNTCKCKQTRFFYFNEYIYCDKKSYGPLEHISLW